MGHSLTHGLHRGTLHGVVPRLAYGTHHHALSKPWPAPWSISCTATITTHLLHHGKLTLTKRSILYSTAWYLYKTPHVVVHGVQPGTRRHTPGKAGDTTYPMRYTMHGVLHAQRRL